MPPPTNPARAQLKAKEAMPAWSQCCAAGIAMWDELREMGLVVIVDLNSVHVAFRKCKTCGQTATPLWVRTMPKGPVVALACIDIDEGEAELPG